MYVEASGGWQVHEAKINSLTEGVKAVVDELKVKVDKLESGLGGRGGSADFGGKGGFGGEGRIKGYLPLKSMVPWAMKDDVTLWRRWRAKVLTYTEHITPGMKQFLLNVSKMEVPPTIDFAKEQSKIEKQEFVEAHREMIYATLLEITEGGAWSIVDGVNGENGYLAWYELHKYFEATLEGRQGQAYSDLTALSKMKAKDPAETRRLVTEMMVRTKLIKDLTGE